MEDIRIISNSTWGYEVEGGFDAPFVADEYDEYDEYESDWDSVSEFLQRKGFALHDDCSVSTRARFDSAEIVVDGWHRDSSVLASVRDLLDVCYELDFVSNETCGIHIHVGKEGDGWEAGQMVRLMYLIAHVEELIFDMLPSSRYDNDYCAPMGLRLREELLSFDPATLDALLFHTAHEPINKIRGVVRKLWHSNVDGRYWGLNIDSYWYRGTIEFRYFDSDEHMLAHYIDLVDKLVDLSQRCSFKELQNVAVMLNEQETRDAQITALLDVLNVAESTKRNLKTNGYRYRAASPLKVPVRRMMLVPAGA
jgi:hypothetical protein